MLNSSAKIQPETTFQPSAARPIEPESETKMIEVFCDLCDETMQGTKANLQRYGWGIYQKICFCPFHEEQV